MHQRLIYLFILTCISTPNFFPSQVTSEMFGKCFRPRGEFFKSSEWTPDRGWIVWAQMDGAAVSNMGPSGGGLTCRPTYHSLMPIDKWVVRCAGLSVAEKRLQARKLGRHIMFWYRTWVTAAHRCWGGIGKEFWGEEGVWLVCVERFT